MTSNPIRIKISLDSPLEAIGKTLYTIFPLSSSPHTFSKKSPLYYQGIINILNHRVSLSLCYSSACGSNIGGSLIPWSF